MRNIQDDDLKLSYSNAFLLNKNAEPDVIEEGESVATGFEISSYELEEGLKGDKNYSLSLAQIQSFKENNSIPSKSSLDQKASDLVGEAFIKISENFKLRMKIILIVYHIYLVT